MQVAFDRIISKLDVDEESLSEWEDMTMQTFKIKRKKVSLPQSKNRGVSTKVQRACNETRNPRKE